MCAIYIGLEIILSLIGLDKSLIETPSASHKAVCCVRELMVLAGCGAEASFEHRTTSQHKMTSPKAVPAPFHNT